MTLFFGDIDFYDIIYIYNNNLPDQVLTIKSTKNMNKFEIPKEEEDVYLHTVNQIFVYARHHYPEVYKQFLDGLSPFSVKQKIMDYIQDNDVQWTSGKFNYAHCEILLGTCYLRFTKVQIEYEGGEAQNLSMEVSKQSERGLATKLKLDFGVGSYTSSLQGANSTNENFEITLNNTFLGISVAVNFNLYETFKNSNLETEYGNWHVRFKTIDSDLEIEEENSLNGSTSNPLSSLSKIFIIRCSDSGGNIRTFRLSHDSGIENYTADEVIKVYQDDSSTVLNPGEPFKIQGVYSIDILEVNENYILSILRRGYHSNTIVVPKKLKPNNFFEKLTATFDILAGSVGQENS